MKQFTIIVILLISIQLISGFAVQQNTYCSSDTCGGTVKSQSYDSSLCNVVLDSCNNNLPAGSIKLANLQTTLGVTRFDATFYSDAACLDESSTDTVVCGLCDGGDNGIKYACSSASTYALPILSMIIGFLLIH